MSAPLSQICEIFAGLPAGAKASTDGVSVNVIGIRSVLGDGRVDLSAPEILHVPSRPEAKKAIAHQDILLALRGTPKAGLVLGSDFPTTYASSNLAILRPNAQVDPVFLWALVQRECREEGQLATFAAGSVQRSLRVKDIALLEVTIPPLEVQRAIGRTVTALQKTIAAQRDATTAAEQMMDAFLTESLSS